MALWTWQYGYCTTDMALWRWHYGHDSMDIALWTWHYGDGTMEMTVWILQYGHGNMEMALWTWHYGHDSIDMAILTWHYEHGTMDMTLRTWHYRHVSMDMAISTWHYGHLANLEQWRPKSVLRHRTVRQVLWLAVRCLQLTKHCSWTSDTCYGCTVHTHTHTHTHTRARAHAVCTTLLHVNSDKHGDDANVWDCIQQSWKSGKAEITGNDRNKPKFACTNQLRAGWIQGTPAAVLPAHFVFQFAILRPYSLTQPHT